MKWATKRVLVIISQFKMFASSRALLFVFYVCLFFFFYCLNTLENGSHTNFNLIFIFLVFHWNEKKMNANSSDSFK